MITGLTEAENQQFAELRREFVVCRKCKVKARKGNAQLYCPECTAPMITPTWTTQASFPTVNALTEKPKPTNQTPTQRVRIPGTGICVLCHREGDSMKGEGLNKSCADTAACAARVKIQRPEANPATHVVKNTTPAQALIDLMQAKCNRRAWNGPFELGDDLTLPLVAAQARYVVFGKPGFGKTHASAVMIENCVHNNVPECAIDKLGRLWGVRARGSGDALPIPIIGGIHGDIPLRALDAVALAQIFAEGQSLLLDVSLLTSEDQQQFAAAFFTELLRVLRRPAHVLVEEAESFAPAFSRAKAHFASQGATTLWARQIRNFGVGWTFSTQRPQLLHPDIVDASSVFIAMQSTGENAQGAIRNDARTRLGRTIADAIIAEVGQLGRGEAWLMPDAGWLGQDASAPVRFRFRERTTYDSTRVPQIGEPMPEDPSLAPVDLRSFERLITEMHIDHDALQKRRARKRQFRRAS